MPSDSTRSSAAEQSPRTHAPDSEPGATRPAGANILQQQAKFDTFIEEFSNKRLHEALEMKCPAQLYTASARCYQGIPEPHYPFHDRTLSRLPPAVVSALRKKINLSLSLAGQAVGVKRCSIDPQGAKVRLCEANPIRQS